MVCPYCHHTKTSVINSRQHREQPQVWRRRCCQRCKVIFTTYEQIAGKELPLVKTASGSETFTMTKLLITIYIALPEGSARADDAQALATTVYGKLARLSSTVLTPQVIAKETYAVLRRFDSMASLRYGTSHSVITPDSLKKS